MTFWDMVYATAVGLGHFLQSQRFMNMIRGGLVIAVAVKVIIMDAQTFATVVGGLEIIFANVTAKTTAPIQRVREIEAKAEAKVAQAEAKAEEKVDQRVADILSDPEEIRMRTGGSGTGIGTGR